VTIQDAIAAALALGALVWLVRKRIAKKRACDGCGLAAAANAANVKVRSPRPAAPHSSSE
jgi:hypothetical protein